MSSIDGLSKINNDYKNTYDNFVLCRTNYLKGCINIVNAYYSNIEIFDGPDNLDIINTPKGEEFISNLKIASNILERLGIIENNIDYCNVIKHKRLSKNKQLTKKK